MCGAAGDHLLVRLDADEGVAADAFAAFDGLQQEGLGLFGGEAQEGGDGGFEVGRDGAVDGHERVGLREGFEVAGGGDRWRAYVLGMLDSS